jgi:hypothetical protein
MLSATSDRLVCLTAFQLQYLIFPQSTAHKTIWEIHSTGLSSQILEMNDTPFITLAAGGMQPESTPSPMNSVLSDNSVRIQPILVQLTLADPVSSPCGNRVPHLRFQSPPTTPAVRSTTSTSLGLSPQGLKRQSNFALYQVQIVS